MVTEIVIRCSSGIFVYFLLLRWAYFRFSALHRDHGGTHRSAYLWFLSLIDPGHLAVLFTITPPVMVRYAMKTALPSDRICFPTLWKIYRTLRIISMT